MRRALLLVVVVVVALPFMVPLDAMPLLSATSLSDFSKTFQSLMVLSIAPQVEKKMGKRERENICGFPELP